MEQPIAIYTRVSTQEQSTNRQLTECSTYAQKEFESGLDQLEIYNDKATGTNTQRKKLKKLLENLEQHDVLIAYSISRIARSMSDFTQIVEKLRAAEVEVHLISEGITITDNNDPATNLLINIMGSVAEMEAQMIQERVKSGIEARMQDDEYHHGRPPLGYETGSEAGKIVPDASYHHVCEVLEQVHNNELSKNKASTLLDTTRKTISSAINNRPQLYGLE